MLRLAVVFLLAGLLTSTTALAQARTSDHAAQPDAAAGGPASRADLDVATFSTTGRDGSWSRVDLIPVFQGSPALGVAPSRAQQALLDALQTLAGTDLN